MPALNPHAAAQRTEALAEHATLSRHLAYMVRQRSTARAEGREWAVPLIDGALSALRDALAATSATVARYARESR